ncbi:Integrase catalytic domain-containing protein [Citrus sinensis]|nr:Integrase catalytic domain-containing protein [Citrus sinensis]
MRSDRGGEFTCKEFVEFCEANGIRPPLIVPRSPQQNGVAERKNIIILDMARSMLKSKRLPKEFWAEAIYLSNQSPTRSVHFQGATLDEKWRIAMDEEIKAIVKNDTWELTTLPKCHKAINVKWEYKTKRNAKGEIEMHKARLVAKGYSQKAGIDYDKFKRVMIKEFEMTNIGLMTYYLDIEVKQKEECIFISQESNAKEILKRFKMNYCKPISTPVECEVKLSKHDEVEDIDPTFFKSLVGSLHYLTCTRPNMLYDVGLIVGYSDSDWGGDVNDRKSTTGFVFFVGDTAFKWMLKKQPIVTLSTCEAEYVAAISSVCHAIWLKNLLKELGLPQEEPSEICVDNKSAIALSKNPVFHDQSKHIDTRYLFIRERIARKEVQIKYVKSQDQVDDIFTKALK